METSLSPADKARLDNLQGQLLAVAAAVRGLILAQPDAASAASAVVGQLEKLTAAALPRALTEATLQGIERGRGLVLPGKSDG